MKLLIPLIIALVVVTLGLDAGGCCSKESRDNENPPPTPVQTRSVSPIAPHGGNGANVKPKKKASIISQAYLAQELQAAY